MKTLFLSSAGVRFPIIKRELLKVLPKAPSQLSLSFVNTAANVVEDDTFSREDEKELRNMGFSVQVVDIAGKNEGELREILGNQDVIYVEGGNGFYLLKQVKESGFEKVIKELIDRGVVYVGVSSGTYIACPTIEMHEWKRVVDNRYGLESLEAMGLVPFLISVHYNREKYRELIKRGISKTTLPVRVLTDDQALLIKDGRVTLVGDGEEVVVE